MSAVLVGIVMGSDTDLPVMKDAAIILDSFGVSNEIKVVSAHRTTEKMLRYAKAAKKRGIKVIIAGAGGSAHLPGMVASITTIPVIGVPIKTATLDGLDSLMSIVQMPTGIPVATVAINGSKNAGILACQILAIKYERIAVRIEKYKKDLEKSVIQRAKEVETEKIKR
ncbi:MAG TPA: 5-(carboxyamino)imidazole ribonucleotide mutase [Nitrososphaeraceae archaeon]|jgi:5-(carboxyamino)imidazole ribonucleotide mutase|nr:5-(carboxyamino)imidazole ribonucleotide mutase [Nitrososphaeraceae archaeon]